MSDFSVVIPSRNATNLAACVGAIRAAGETCRIIVVDNGLSERPEGCEYVDFFEPFVFAKAINIGIKSAGDSDIIATNDDALLETERGFTLMAAKSATREFGLIAAACDQVGNPNQFKRSDSLLRVEPRMVCFTCVYIPRSTINTVGLLDEDFGGTDDRGQEIYGFCDDHYCYRVRKAGLKLGVYDGCYVDHGSLESSFRHDKPRSLEPGQRLFIRKTGVDNWMQGKETSQWRYLFE